MCKVRHFQQIQEGLWLPHAVDLGFSLNKTKLTLVPIIYFIKTDEHARVRALGCMSLADQRRKRKYSHWGNPTSMYSN